MKFPTKHKAEQWRKQGPCPQSHQSVKTRYWSMTKMVWINCWTVIFIS